VTVTRTVHEVLYILFGWPPMAVRRREKTWNLEPVVRPFQAFSMFFLNGSSFQFSPIPFVFTGNYHIFISDENDGRLPDISMKNSKLQGNCQSSVFFQNSFGELRAH
jgi:hypothetical protein